jgi:hypothetical protein
MKKFFVIALTVISVLFTANSQADWLESYKNSGSRDMCMSESFDQKVDNVLLEGIPSILDQCGIGGIFDFCGKLGAFGKIFGDLIGCGSGGNGGGGGSNFCDWGFDAKTAKNAWKIYNKASIDNNNNERENILVEKYEDQYAMDAARLKALGITL